MGNDPSIVPTGVTGERFEFTPGGITATTGMERVTPEGAALFLNVRTTGEGGDPAAAAPAQEQPRLTPSDALLRPGPPKAKPVTDRDVVRLARKRRKELKAEIRRLKKAEAELAQLERLIAAAEGRQLASVRNLEPSRRHG